MVSQPFAAVGGGGAAAIVIVGGVVMLLFILFSQNGNRSKRIVICNFPIKESFEPLNSHANHRNASLFCITVHCAIFAIKDTGQRTQDSKREWELGKFRMAASGEVGLIENPCEIQ